MYQFRIRVHQLRLFLRHFAPPSLAPSTMPGIPDLPPVTTKLLNPMKQKLISTIGSIIMSFDERFTTEKIKDGERVKHMEKGSWRKTFQPFTFIVKNVHTFHFFCAVHYFHKILM